MTSAESQLDAPPPAPPAALIGLYELTQALVYPDGTEPDEPDVPYTQGAKQVWLSHGDDQYGGIAHSPQTTLYHPTAFRNAAGLPMGTPTFGAGMRCYAWYNRQSGRWEIIAPALCVVQIELSATLAPGDSSVTAYLLDDPAVPEITVYVNSADYLGFGRAGSEEAINTGSTGTVSLWWTDYATGNLADSGQDVTALNWLWPNIAPGDKVIVSYDRQENRWSVIGTE